MPRVEAYPGDRVQTRPLPDLRRTAVRAPESQAGLASIGEGLDRVASAVAQIHEEQQREADQLALTVGKRQFNELYQQQALSDADHRGPNGTQGLLTMQGIEAHDKLEANLREYDEGADRILQQAKTKSQRLLLEGLRDNERARYVESGMQHSTTEFAKFKEGQDQALLLSTMETAAAAAGTANGAEIITSQLVAQAQLIAVRGKQKGQSQEQVTEAIAEARSKTHLAVLNKLVDMGDDIAATEYYERVTATPDPQTQPPELLDSDAARIREKLDVNSTDGEGRRLAQALFAEMGPKNPGDPVNTFQIAQEARKRAKTTKVGERAVEYLKTFELEFEGQQANVQKAINGTLADYYEREVPLAEVMKSAAWANADPTVRAKFHEDVNNRERQRIADSRATHNYNQSLLNEPLEAAQRAEAMRNLKGADTYYALVFNPGRLVTMDETDIAAVTRNLGHEQAAHVQRLWTDVRGNVRAASAAKADTDMFNQAAYEAGFTFAYAPKTNEEKDTLNQLRLAVEAEIARAQMGATAKSGTLTKLDVEEQRQLMKTVIDNKVMQPGGWGSKPVVAAVVPKDQYGRVWIAFEKIPPKARTAMRAWIRSQPSKAGVTATHTLGDTEVDAKYGEAMSRAWAASLSGADDTVWQGILGEALGTYQPPPAARPVGASTPAPPRRVVQTGPRPTIPRESHAPIPPPPAPEPTHRPPEPRVPRRPHPAASATKKEP